LDRQACNNSAAYLFLPQVGSILTNYGFGAGRHPPSSLPAAITAYKQRMGIEEMFRDYKTGGYNLEGTGLKGERLIKIIMLMAIAYSSAIFQGTEIQKKQVQKYISRSKEPRKKYRRRSTFGIGQDGELWVNYLAQHSEIVQELMKLTPNKRRFYQQGVRAGTLIWSIS
jgi:hypothetical protein